VGTGTFFEALYKHNDPSQLLLEAGKGSEQTPGAWIDTTSGIHDPRAATFQSVQQAQGDSTNAQSSWARTTDVIYTSTTQSEHYSDQIRTSSHALVAEWFKKEARFPWIDT
jgi:hypothetical protein